MNELKQQILKEFEEKFDSPYITERPEGYPSIKDKIKDFLSSAITTAYEKGRVDARKEIFDWCNDRCEENVKLYGTNKWNSDLEQLAENLREEE